MDVKQDLETDTAQIISTKANNTLLIIRDEKKPSLLKLKWHTGPSPDVFSQRFTDLPSAINFGVKYIESMKTTQAAKNKRNSERREKKREQIDKDSEASNTVRKGSDN